MSLDIHSAFDQVRADEHLKASTKRFLREARQKKGPRSVRTPRLAAVMASLIVCVLCFGGFSYLNTPVSYISIDVNPSIELTLNRLHRVVSAQAWNADAQIVLQDVHVTGLTFSQAIDAILESEAMQPYLAQRVVLSFTVAADSEQTEELLLAGIGECPGYKTYRGFCASADEALIQEAHHCGVSFGKYQAYQTLVEQGADITLDECRDMSMNEIHSLMHEHDAGDGHEHRKRQGEKHRQENSKSSETGSPSASSEHRKHQGRSHD